MRSGSGCRASALGSLELMISPRKLGSLCPSISSKSAERGLANWPAVRAILVTGRRPAKVSTIAICSSTLKVSRTLSALNSAKDSAQSPPCSRNPLPSATCARRFLRSLISCANTSGGSACSRVSTSRRRALSGYSGCCRIGKSRQLETELPCFGGEFIGRLKSCRGKLRKMPENAPKRQ